VNAALVDGIVKAVLYEGLLYPYRPSAVKNRQRFNFGVVYPRACCDAKNSGDASAMQTECLVAGNEKTECLVRVRFLRMVDRSIARLTSACDEHLWVEPEKLERVERLETNGQIFQPWQEAAEETIGVPGFAISNLVLQPMKWPFRSCAKQEREPIRDETGEIVGVIERSKANLEGVIELKAGMVAPDIFKLTVIITNQTCVQSSRQADRELALSQALVSAHTILEVSDGEFISLVDPPERHRDLVRDCQNVGTWPVLVGEEGELNTMLSSPIILYDYPQIAPESPGDLFDGAEIDEILSLRILTMTDEEKREMRQSDDRARRILERTEALAEEHWTKLHGALRGLRSAKEELP
jgi:hydrogenase maturation protease